MKWNTTALLLLVTVGIGAYISLYEIKQPSPERRDRLARQIVSIPAETVTEIVIESPEANVTLSREGTLWRLAPQGARADANVVSAMLGHTASLIAERILSDPAEQKLSRSAFGLDPAVGRLTLLTDDTSTTLLFGEATSVQNNRYLQLADRPEIFIVRPSLFDTINQPIDAFRDRRLIRFTSVLADALAVTSTDVTFRLTRRDDDWYLTEPVDDRADHSQVNALLGRLAGIEIQRFLEEAWLEAPKAEVTVTHGEPPTTTTLRFGTPLADDETLIYATRSDEPYVYAVAAEDLEALLKDPSSLRTRACFDFFTSEVNKVEVAWEGTRWTMEGTNGQWRASFDPSTVAQGRIPSDVEGVDSAQDAPPEPAEGQAADSGEELDPQQVEPFLSRLADVRVSGFLEGSLSNLASFGLSDPVGTIAVWTATSDEPQRLLIGATVSQSVNRYGLIESRHALVELPDSVTQLLATTPDDLRPADAAHSLSPLNAPKNAR